MKRLALILSLILSIFVTSCSVNYHLNKAIKKGYRCEEVSDTIQITSIDSIPVIVHDSIIWEKVLVQKDTIIRYKQSIVPKTRFQIRFDNKRFADSLKAVRRMYSDSLKADVKMHRVSAKENVQLIKHKTRQNKKRPNLFLFGLVTGVILTIIIRYAINQALKKFA